MEARKKHSHRCKKCGNAVYCYKSQCVKPSKIDMCQWCKPIQPVNYGATYRLFIDNPEPFK